MCVAGYDADRDTGAFVVPAFKQPAKFDGARVLMSRESLTLRQMADIYTAETGEKTKVAYPPLSVLDGKAPAELIETFRWFGAKGYYGGEGLGTTQALYEGPVGTSFREYVRAGARFAA